MSGRTSKKRLTRLRRSIHALAGAHARLESRWKDKADPRLVEAMAFIRAAYRKIYPVKREEQKEKNDGLTLRDGFAALALKDPNERKSDTDQS